MTDYDLEKALDQWLDRLELRSVPSRHVVRGGQVVETVPGREVRYYYPDRVAHATGGGLNVRPRVEVAFLPIEPEQLTVRSPGSNRRRFIYQVTVVHDLVAVIDEQHLAHENAERIVAHFDVGRLDVQKIRTITHALAIGDPVTFPGTPGNPRTRGYEIIDGVSRYFEAQRALDGGSTGIGTGATHPSDNDRNGLPSNPAQTLWTELERQGTDLQVKPAAAVTWARRTPVWLPGEPYGVESVWIRARPQTGLAFAQGGVEWRVPVTIRLETFAD